MRHRKAAPHHGRIERVLLPEAAILCSARVDLRFRSNVIYVQPCLVEPALDRVMNKAYE